MSKMARRTLLQSTTSLIASGSHRIRMDGVHLHRIALAVDEMFARVMKMELQQPIVSGLRGAHADARHRTRRHRRWNGQPSSGRSDRLIRVTTPSHARFSACG
jgi:hypothetical protein